MADDDADNQFGCAACTDAHAEWLSGARTGDLFVMKRLHGATNNPSALLTLRAPGVSSAGHSACHWVAAGGHIACLRWLLSLPEAGTLVCLRNNGHSTPLHSAAANGHAACVEALLAAGADATAQDAAGDTPFACAASRGYEAAAQPLAPYAPPHAFLQLGVGKNRVGRLVFELDEAKAPRACANFLGLCEGFRARARAPGALYGRDGELGPSTSVHFGYRGSSFHRLLPGQVRSRGHVHVRGCGRGLGHVVPFACAHPARRTTARRRLHFLDPMLRPVHSQVLHGGRLSGGDLSIFGPRFNDELQALRTPQSGRGLLCMANSGPDTNASQVGIPRRRSDAHAHAHAYAHA